MTILHNLLRGSPWAMAEVWGRQAASLLLFMVLARLLSPGDVGLFAIVMVMQALMQVFIDDGIGEAVVQRAALDDAHLDTAFWFNLAAAGAIALAAIALSPWLATLFHDPRLIGLISIMGAVLVIGSAGGIHQAVLRRSFDYRSLAMRSVLGILIAGIVGVGLAFAGAGVWALAAQQVIERLVGTIILWVRSDWRPKWRWSKPHARELLPYGLNIIASRGLIFTYKQADRFLVGLLLGPVVLGVYALALRIFDTMAALLVQATTGIALSAFSRLQHDRPALRDTFYAVTELAALGAFPAFIGLAAIAPTLVALLFGAKWAASGPVLQILALMGIPYWIGAFSSTIMRALGRPGWYLAVLGAGTIINIIAVLYCYRYGLLAVAAVLALRETLFVPVNIAIVHHLLGIDLRLYLTRQAPALLAGTALAAAVLEVGQVMPPEVPPLALLVAQVVAGGVVYAGVLRGIGRAGLGRVVGMLRQAREIEIAQPGE